MFRNVWAQFITTVVSTSWNDPSKRTIRLFKAAPNVVSYLLKLADSLLPFNTWVESELPKCVLTEPVDISVLLQKQGVGETTGNFRNFELQVETDWDEYSCFFWKLDLRLEWIEMLSP